VDAAPLPPDPAPAPHLCPNCGAAAPGRFCARCGQRQDRRLASVRRMAVEAVQDQFSIGAELPVTLKALLFQPGHLTRDYLAGRIARYVPPLRLYLVASLAFFFILSWTADFENPLAEARADIEAARDSAVPAQGDSSGLRVRVSGMDSARIGFRFDTTDASGWLTPLKIWGQRRVDRLNTMDRDELYRRFMDGFQRNAPRAVFVLLPIYALVLKLLYLRRNRLYAEHFVFALHVHAFVFVLFSAALALRLPDWLDTLMLWVWVPVYVFLAMLRVYGQGIPKTLLKYGILFVAYCTVLIFLLVATALATALTI
jgi:hypothetical protein